MISVLKKEVLGYMNSSFSLVFLGIFLFISGIVFSTYNLLGMRGDMNGMFGIFSQISIMVFPILTMKTFAEERSLKTEQLLMTSRLSCWQIVLGKYFATMVLFLVALLGTLVYVVILLTYGSPNIGSIVGSYIGFMLLGSAFIAVCLFVASLADSQIVAAIGSFGVLFMSVIIGALSKSVHIPIIQKLLTYLSITTMYERVTRGVLSLEPVVYYLVFSGIFVFLTIKSLEKRAIT